MCEARRRKLGASSSSGWVSEAAIAPLKNTSPKRLEAVTAADGGEERHHSQP